MNAPAKLGAFVAALAVVFGGATAVGAATGPIGFVAGAADNGELSGRSTGAGSGADGGHSTGTDTGSGTGTGTETGVQGDDHAGQAAEPEADEPEADEPASRPVGDPPGGLAVSQDGYTLRLSRDQVPAGRETALGLVIEGPDARPVRAYTATHDKELHLIVVRPYLAAYGHLVVLRDGDLAYLHVHPGGEPEDGRTPAGPRISFHATAPTAGDYRLFRDFRHRGKVRTAAFTARALPAPALTGSTPTVPAPTAPGHTGSTPTVPTPTAPGHTGSTPTVPTPTAPGHTGSGHAPSEKGR